MKTKIFLSATITLFCGGFVWCALHSMNGLNIVSDVTQIPQGAYEQIILEYNGATDEEVCRIYAENMAYWNEIDVIMCKD